MADININKFRTSVVREGSRPASAGFVESEGQDPVDPAGSTQNHLPVTIAPAATALSITDSQVLGGAGTVAQYVRGDGSLADFPQSIGSGASVSYYLNGSVNQGTIGGVTYYEMNKTPIIGAGTDFTRNSNGYIASFLTDANDPALLVIPAGNWNFETYFEASSGGGSPTFYLELYKYDGTTFSLIASNSGSPKLINDGTSIEAYFSALAVPQTTLTLTDRLAIRIYVTTAGRTITLHTENGHLCQVITTFTTGLSALNGLTSQVQFFAVGTSGTNFNIASATDTHTFNLPTASATNRGALSSTDWSTFNNKQNQLNGTGFVKASGTTITYDNSTYQVTSEKGQPNGYASLDGNGKVPLAQINDALIGNVNYQGLWNAATNNPTLVNPPSSGTKGYYYIVSTAGTFASISFEVGDWIISNGSAWQKVDNTDAVSSVFGRTGNVIAANGDYNTSQVTENTNLYYTEARVSSNTDVAANTAARHNAVTLGTANGLSLSTQQLSLQLASGSQNGALSSTDWTTFNSKENAITAGTTAQYFRGDKTFQTLNTAAVPELTNLYYTEARVSANTDVAANTAARHAAVTLGIANGLGLSGQQLSLGLASAGVTGALSGTDWSTFNSKQQALNGTGFVKISGTTISYDNSTYYLASNPSAFITLTSLSNVAPIQYNNTTGAISITQASGSTNGFLSSTDWNTFNSKQQALNGTGFVKISGTTISYDNSTYLTTAAAASTYLPLAGGTLTGALNGTSATLNSNFYVSGGTLTNTGNGVHIFNESNFAQIQLNGATGSLIDFSTSGTDSLARIIYFNSSETLNLINAGTTALSIGSTGVVTLSNLGGTGTRMVVASSTGVLSTQSITVGTVTSVAALTLGTSGTDLSSTVANSTTTPVITLNVPTASASNRGALSAADWTTFNNKQNALTNPVTGTGTTNYLPKFTGASTIGNSAITDDGTLVEINAREFRITRGTTDQFAFGVNVTSTFAFGSTNGRRTAIIYTSGEQDAGLQFGYDAVDKTGIIAGSASNTGAGIDFYTFNGSAWGNRLRLNKEGNLGLGVTPSAWGSSTFKVFDIGSTTSLYYDGGTILSENSFINSSFQYIYKTTNFASRYDQVSGQHRWFNAPSGTAGNAISFTQAMTLFASGNLAVGPTTDAGFKLDVNGTGRFSGALSVNNAANIYHQVAIKSNGTLSYQGLGVYSSSNDRFISMNHTGTEGFIETENAGSGVMTPLSLKTGGQTRLTIASSGAATFSSSVTANYISSIISSSSNASPLILQNTSGWGSSQITSISVKDAIDVVGAIGWKYDGVANVDMLFHSLYNGAYKTVSNVVMTVKGTGNVGIGTTSPSGKFEIASFANTYPSAPAITFTDTSGDASSNRWIIGNIATTYGTFNIASAPTPSSTTYTSRLSILSNGNVGIGTTSPTDTIGYGRALDIQSSTGAVIYLRDSDAPTTQYGFIAYDGNDNGLKLNNENSSGFIRFNTAGSERMRIFSDGNVGINTGATNAGYKLDVNGTGRFNSTSSTPFLINTNTDNTTTIRTSNGGGNAYISFENSGDANNAFAIGRSNSGDFVLNHSASSVYGGGTLTNYLNISSTGAATFSSSVTAGGNLYVSGGTNTNVGNGIHAYYESNYAQVQLNGATGSLIDFSTSGTDYIGRILFTNATSAMQFFTNTTGNPVLTLTTTGAATFSSSVTAASFIPSGSTIPTNGMYLPSANTIAFSTNTTQRISVSSAGEVQLKQSSNSAQNSVIFNTTIQNAMTLNSSGFLILNGTTGSSRITCYGDGYFSGGIQTGNPYGSTSANWLLGRFLTETTSANGSIRVQIGSKYYNIAAEDLGTVPT